MKRTTTSTVRFTHPTDCCKTPRDCSRGGRIAVISPRRTQPAGVFIDERLSDSPHASWPARWRSSSSSAPKRCRKGLSGRSSSSSRSALSSAPSAYSPPRNSVRHVREISCSVSKTKPRTTFFSRLPRPRRRRGQGSGDRSSQVLPPSHLPYGESGVRCDRR